MCEVQALSGPTYFCFVLVLAGIELISLTVASKGFGLVL